MRKKVFGPHKDINPTFSTYVSFINDSALSSVVPISADFKLKKKP